MSRRPLASLVAALVLLPVAARAHLVQTGFGPFYDGVSHFGLTVEDLLPAIAMGILAGLRGRDHGRAVMLLFPAAWAIGGLAATGELAPALPPLLPIASFLILGALVATDARLPRGPVLAAAALIGLAHGAMNGRQMLDVDLGVPAVLGVVAAAFFVVTVTAAFTVSRRAPWTRIAFRVAGSWIMAIGLLRLGWALAGRA